ncbi:hypothetical protein [Formosa sp. Hel1_33_131]|uniref:hypothetical protein n=1 Tax=Formosa sp. Hel1_33_131 TaxID=1336794 RepID=UPI00084E2966|nr:hypothetical protein [Formosa sp. Hel1_33_131]
MKSITILCLFLLLFGSCNLAPGSYPYVERYTIKLSEEKLIDVIKKFKKDNQNYIVQPKYGFVDGRSSGKDHWYHIYFNNPQKSQIMYVWVRKKSKTETILAFVSVKKHSDLGNWKRINKDFTKSKNKAEIKEFENRILYSLGINDFIED